MLHTPWSLGFVLAAVAGAMLVPGCRPQDGPSGPSESLDVSSPQFSSSRVIQDEYMVGFKSPETESAQGGYPGERTERVGWNYRGAVER